MEGKEMEEEIVRDMTPRLIGETWRKYPTEKSTKKARYGLYECQYCGSEFETASQSVKSGGTKSCGCYAREVQTTHGISQNKFYNTWCSMKHRCYNTKRQEYKYYGARGITVCEEWLDVANFVAWAEKTHPNREGYTLDRIDSNKGYSPDNCRWVDKSTQVINQRMRRTNTSGFVGVYWNNKNNNWRTFIYLNNVRFNIGSFLTIEEAVLARDNYIIENKLPHKLSTDYVKETE